MSELSKEDVQALNDMLNNAINVREQIKDKCIRYNNKIYCLNTDGTITVYTVDTKDPDECPSCVLKALFSKLSEGHK